MFAKLSSALLTGAAASLAILFAVPETAEAQDRGAREGDRAGTQQSQRRDRDRGDRWDHDGRWDRDRRWGRGDRWDRRWDRDWWYRPRYGWYDSGYYRPYYYRPYRYGYGYGAPYYGYDYYYGGYPSYGWYGYRPSGLYFYWR